LSKLVAPNSCAFCEITHDRHGSRGDGLHPYGVWTWVEPSDRLRLQRMKRNRQIREGTTMETQSTDLEAYWIGKMVTYHGNRRVQSLGNGKTFPVIDVRADGKAVCVDTGNGDSEWIGVNSVKVVKDAPTVADFLNPHSTTISVLDAEITRLEDKLRELRAARQVISGL
jgi:hypothetical protein